MAAWTHHRTDYNPLICPSSGEISVQETIQTANVSLRYFVDGLHLGEGASESLRTPEDNKAILHWRGCKRSCATSASAIGAFLLEAPSQGHQSQVSVILLVHCCQLGQHTIRNNSEAWSKCPAYSHTWHSWQQQFIWAVKLGQTGCR